MLTLVVNRQGKSSHRGKGAGFFICLKRSEWRNRMFLLNCISRDIDFGDKWDIRAVRRYSDRGISDLYRYSFLSSDILFKLFIRVSASTSTSFPPPAIIISHQSIYLLLFFTKQADYSIITLKIVGMPFYMLYSTWMNTFCKMKKINWKPWLRMCQLEMNFKYHRPCAICYR